MSEKNVYPFPVVRKDLDIPIPPKRIYLDVERFEEALYELLRAVLALFTAGLGVMCVLCAFAAVHLFGLDQLFAGLLGVCGLIVVVIGAKIGGIE